MNHEVVAALIIQSHKILLGLRSADREFYPNVWDVFGGHMEPGEQQHQTLVRELQEELGITPTQWTYLETIQFSPISSPGQHSDPWSVHLYIVTAWVGTPTNRQFEEHSAIGWFSLAEAIQIPLADPNYPTIFERYLSSDFS